MSRVIVLVFACLSLAQPALADDDDLVRAEARWKQGKAFYDAGQWDQAIVEFRAAWEITKEPDLIFGIGLALHKKGDLKGALQHFKQYLELAPAGGAANEARELVVVLTPKVEAADAEAAREAKRKQKEQEEAEAKRRTDEQARVQHERAVAAAIASAERRSQILWWSGISTAVVGGVVVGVGAKFGLDARAATDELSEHTDGAWTDALLARQAEGRSANRKFIALTAIGGVAITGGAVMFVLGLRATPSRTETARAWTLEPVDHGTGLALGGAF